MLKLMGGLLVIAATGLAGWGVARVYAHRPRQLRLLIAALQLLETEITYAATPLPDALRRAALQTEAPVDAFFLQAAQELDAHLGCTAQEAWQRSLDLYYPRSALGRGDAAILRGLGHNIGISDREDQGKHLRLAAEQLKAALVMAEDAALKNVKMWNYLGLLGGLIVVLMLY